MDNKERKDRWRSQETPTVSGKEQRSNKRVGKGMRNQERKSGGVERQRDRCTKRKIGQEKKRNRHTKSERDKEEKNNTQETTR